MVRSRLPPLTTWLELLKAGLSPFVDREVQTAVKAQRIDAATLRRVVDDPLIGDKAGDRLGRRGAPSS